MSLVKESQLSLDGTDILMPDHNSDDDLFIEDSNDLLNEHHMENPLEDILLHLSQDSEDPALVFTLDNVPGGLDQDDIVEEGLEVEEEPEEIEVNDDPWAWNIKNFLEWLSKKMQSVPSHSGKDSVGIERAIAYLERVDREISKAVRSDLNNEIAIDAVEKAREEIRKGLDRLQERLEKIMSSKYKKKKKAGEELDGFVKEAQKSAHVGGIVVNVPLFVSAICRTLINGMVTAGKDIEDNYKKLDGKYKFTPREKLEVFQLLADMGYPVRRDRGMVDEEIDTTSTDNIEWGANYYA